jgi:LysM repeat protein
MLIAVAMAIAPAAYADSGHIHFKTQKTYVVKKGDTLWGIAGHFLDNPWQWPRVWHANPYISNPNLIYPGEQIVVRKGHSGRLEIREVMVEPVIGLSPIPTVSKGSVLPFLGAPGLTANKDSYNKLAYIAASTSTEPALYTGDTLYTSGLSHEHKGQLVRIVRAGRPLYSHDKKPLGISLADLGTAVVTHAGKHAAIKITESLRSVTLGDRLIPVGKPSIPYYFPSAPSHHISGYIVGGMSGYPELTTSQTVIIDKGADAGLKDGNILQVKSPLTETTNAVTKKPFKLPSKTIADVMIYRVFKNVSYAIITKDKRGVLVNDKVAAK